MKKHVKRCACMLLILAMAVLSGCGGKKNVSGENIALLPAPGIASDICEVVRGDHYASSAFEAFVAAHCEELYFTVDGVIGEILVDTGDAVQKGQKLISLNLDAKRERAQALSESIERAKRSNDYANRLMELDIAILETEKQKLIAENADSKTIALKELDILEKQTDLRQQRETQALSLSTLEKELEEIRLLTANDAIYAPFDGVISRGITVSAGQSVKAYDTVLCLTDDTRLRLMTPYLPDFNFKSATGGIYALIGDKRYDILHLETDMEEYVAKTLVGETVYSEFDITGPEDWRDNVEAGQYALIVLVNNYLEDVLMIPANVVLSDTDGKYVYVVGENGERIKRSIKIRNYNNYVNSVVLEGLEEGERIYVTDK